LNNYRIYFWIIFYNKIKINKLANNDLNILGCFCIGHFLGKMMGYRMNCFFIFFEVLFLVIFTQVQYTQIYHIFWNILICLLDHLHIFTYIWFHTNQQAPYIKTPIKLPSAGYIFKRRLHYNSQAKISLNFQIHPISL
jgi:hypothetical protein